MTKSQLRTVFQILMQMAKDGSLAKLIIEQPNVDEQIMHKIEISLDGDSWSPTHLSLREALQYDYICIRLVAHGVSDQSQAAPKTQHGIHAMIPIIASAAKQTST